MKALSEIEIKYYEGDTVKVRYKAPVTASALVHYELMNSHYAKLSFHTAKAIDFHIGDFIELPNWGRFEITDPVKPQYDGAEYTYEPQFDAYYRKWKNKKVRYIPENSSSEASFTLTASILVHARMILRNLADLASKDKSYLFNRSYTATDTDTIGTDTAVYGKTDFTISVDSTVDVKKARNISYQNINILDAITQIANTFECEWWVTENVIHFGECKLEQKANIELKFGDNVATMSSSQSTSNYFTRLYSFGAARNLPDTYKKDSSADITKDGVVEQRLMLPTPYELTAYAATSDTAKAAVEKANKAMADNGFELVSNYLQVKGLTEQGYVEGVITNDDDYPKNILKVGKIETYQKTVKNNATADENDTITRTYYRLSDLTLVNEDGVAIGTSEFLDKYILEGKDLSILFQSGSLNGLDFICKFNPLGKPLYKTNSDGAFIDKNGNATTDKTKYVINPEAQCFEVVGNENHGRFLPDPDLCPKVGDTFVLYNWDASKMPGNLIMAASVDLLLDTIEYLKKSMIDPTTYTVTMLSDYVFKNNRYFSLGEAVKLNNPAYFTTPRESRVIGYEVKLDIPWDNPQYTIGEKPSYSKIGELAQQMSEIQYNGVTYSGSDSVNGGGGTSIYLVKSDDLTPFSDTNTLSSLRSQKEFLSKTQDDSTDHKLTMGGAEVTGDAKVDGNSEVVGNQTVDKDTIHKGSTQFGETFVPGLVGKGGRIDGEGRGEMRSLRLWESLEVPEIRYNRVSVYTGIRWDTFGGGIIETVTPDSTGAETGTCTLKLEDGEYGAIAVGDLCMGIWHDTTGNSTEAKDDNKGNFLFKGFKTVYFQITGVSGENNNTFTYLLRSSADGGNGIHPFAFMHFAGRGNIENEERQSFTYTTTEYTVSLTGVKTWEFQADNYYSLHGHIEGFSMPSVDSNGNKYTKTFHGYGNVMGNAYIFGGIDQFERVGYRMFIDQSLNGSMSPADKDGETVTCTILDGYNHDCTSQFTLYSVTRNSGDSASDAVWNQSHTNVGNPFKITYSDLGIDGIHKLLVTFTVTATDEATDAKAAKNIDFQS